MDDDQHGTPAARTEATRLSDVILPLLDDAWGRLGRGERVIWEASIQALPEPVSDPLAPRDANGVPMPNWAPMVVVYAEIPGIQLNTRLLKAFPVQTQGWTQDMADQIVRQLIDVLLDGRSQEVASMQNAMEEARRNGDAAPTSGLIVPPSR